MKNKDYQVTIGYRAVITVDVKANSIQEAKDKAIVRMKKERDKMFGKGDFNLQEDRFAADGVVDMDETWNALYK